MRLPSRTPAAGFALFATAIALTGALTACTPGDPAQPTSSSGSASATAAAPEKSATPTPAPTIEAVLVVASVDVDGKHVSASGYIQGVVEDGGTCVFTYEREGTTVTADHEGAADRMTTSCGLVQTPIDQFVRGSWSLTLSYEHDGTTYESVPTTVEVP